MMTKQQMTDVESRGLVEQRADVKSEQIMRGIRAAGDVRQLIEVASGNLDQIADELAKLRSEVNNYDPHATAELERLRNAESAARDSNSEGVIKSLKGTARWVGDFAMKIGTTVVAKIIEKQMDF